MNIKIKKILASLLLIVSSLLILALIDDRFVRLFIITCILFSLIYLRKRNIRKLERQIEAENQLDKETQAESSKE